MTLTFDIIKKKRFLSYLRWVMIIPMFICIFLDSENSKLIYKIIMGISLGFYILLTISFFLFIKRFIIIGSIILEDRNIILRQNGIVTNYPLDQVIDLKIIRVW